MITTIGNCSECNKEMCDSGVNYGTEEKLLCFNCWTDAQPVKRLNKLTNNAPAKQVPVSGSDVYNNIYGDFLGKLTEPKKTVPQDCSVSSMEIDEEIGMIEVYWRTEQDPVETKIIVERIEAKDENGIVYEVKLSERDMCSVVEEIYLEIAKNSRA